MQQKEFRWRTKAIQFMNELKSKGYEPKLTYWNDSFGTTLPSPLMFQKSR